MPTTAQNIYGTDLPSLPDLDPNMREISGTSVLAQDIVKRWTSTLFYAPGRSVDIRSYLSKGLTNQQVYAIKDVLEQTAQLDERIQQCTCGVAPDSTGQNLTITGQFTPNVGPSFQLIALVTTVNVQLIGVQ